MPEPTQVYALRIEPGREGKRDRYQFQSHAGSDWRSQDTLSDAVALGGSILFEGQVFTDVGKLNAHWRQTMRP